MAAENIIPFSSRDHIVRKARQYVADMERFLEEFDTAVPWLIRALPVADVELKDEIILLLGGFSKEQVVWPLYEVMMDEREDEEIRYRAAIQISVTAGGMSDNGPIADKLEKALHHSDAMVRRNAAIAMGWTGNRRAVAPLMNLLYDDDAEVRQTAVNALANLDVEDVFQLLRERLTNGSVEIRRAILYNLWRFSDRTGTVLDMIRPHLDHPDDGLRLDALVVFSTIADPSRHLDVYLNCLNDPFSSIRELSLKQIDKASVEVLDTARDNIAALVEDRNPVVRSLALKVWRRLNTPTPLKDTSGPTPE